MKKESAFLTGGSLPRESPRGKPSDPVNVEEIDDKRFCQALDEVERIRQRILQRAAAGSAGVVVRSGPLATPSLEEFHAESQEPSE